MSSPNSRKSSKERTRGPQEATYGDGEFAPHRGFKRSFSMKDKWHKTFKSVKGIGFKRFEEQLKDAKDPPEEEEEPVSEAHSLPALSPKHSTSSLPRNFRGHIIVPLTQERLCAVCRELVGGPTTPGPAGLKCEQCKISYHVKCEEEVKECRWSEEYQKNRLAKKNRTISTSSENQIETPVAPKLIVPPHEVIEKAAQERVDPVYYLLKQATGIRTKLGPQDNPNSPLASNVPSIVTDTAGCHDSDFNISQCSTSDYSSASHVASASLHLTEKDQLSVSHYSAPSLSYLKSPSIDSQGSDYGSDTQQRQLPPKPKTPALRRPPNLDSTMKSLSLDSHDDAPYYPTRMSPSGGHSPSHGKFINPHRRHRMHSSIDTDEASNASGSPCVSNSGSVASLPHSYYVVLREFRANGPDELSVHFGERVTVLDATDSVWWQVRSGQAPRNDGRVGIIPAACLHRIYNNERLIRVCQNLQLCEGNRSLRLYKDQIVFGCSEDADGNIKIRTDDDYRAKCPARYLGYME